MSLYTRTKPRLRFETLQTQQDVADALAISVADLRSFSDERLKATAYTPIHLEKKGKRHDGEFRVVYEVAREARRLHLEVLEALRAEAKLSDRAYGFVRDRTILDNAKQHHGASRLLNVDIRDFFGSISESKVTRAFLTLGCGEHAAIALASICSLLGSLPQGAAASPILSNVVCIEMDNSLEQLASRVGAKYTRYADDITFSGNDVPQLDSIRSVLQAYDFVLNEDKTCLRRSGEAQYVTGLTLGSERGVRLPTRFRRYLRLRLHYAHVARLAGFGGHGHDNWISGALAFAISIEETWTKQLIAKFPRGVPEGWGRRAFPPAESDT